MERMKTQVELLKECCDIKDAACVRYQKRIAELEEENKKLKKECEENDYLVEDNARWMKKCEEKTMEIKKLKEELSKKSMEAWFDKKAKNIFIDKSGKVIKGGEFTTLC